MGTTVRYNTAVMEMDSTEFWVCRWVYLPAWPHVSLNRNRNWLVTEFVKFFFTSASRMGWRVETQGQKLSACSTLLDISDWQWLIRQPGFPLSSSAAGLADRLAGWLDWVPANTPCFLFAWRCSRAVHCSVGFSTGGHNNVLNRRRRLHWYFTHRAYISGVRIYVTCQVGISRFDVFKCSRLADAIANETH